MLTVATLILTLLSLFDLTVSLSSNTPTTPTTSTTTSSSSSSSSPKIPIYFDASTHLHRDIKFHPEQPARIRACIKALATKIDNPTSCIQLVNVAPTDFNEKSVDTDNDYFSDLLVDSPTGLCVDEPFEQFELVTALQRLLQIHDNTLVLRVQEYCSLAKQRRIDQGKDSTLGFVGRIDDDTYLTTESFDICLRATAAWIRAVNEAKRSEPRRPTFALTRPPSHHALSNQSNGFCLYNFAAAAAVHAIQEASRNNVIDRSPKVSVIDWDVHYGQGTADILQHYPQVRFVSIHQTPAFPYMGESYKVMGDNNNVMTIPIPPETTWACGYQEHFEKALDFACKQGEWEPNLVIVSAGYDALDSDDLASCNLRADDFYTMTNMLVQRLKSEQAEQMPALMFGLEGGYQLSDSAAGGNLQLAVVATIKALIEQYDLSSSTAAVSEEVSQNQRQG